MSFQMSILLYGRDKHLLGTRLLLLQRAGYRVLVATELAQIDVLSRVEVIDLLMLCHSLTPEECGHVIDFCQFRWPFMKSLVLSALGSRCEGKSPDRVFETSQGPAKLLATLGHILDHQSSSHSHLY
jgi:hypothetical protein